MYLIAGLGNPGAQYGATRHNIGFMVLDHIALQQGFSFVDSKWNAQVAKVGSGARQVIYVKPETFMNNSGLAVEKICSYYKITPDKVLVVQDDLDLDFGRSKLVVNRGAGGHKGILSIMQHLGNNDFFRLRVGIGRPSPGESIAVSNYVLAKFTPDEESTVNRLLGQVADSVQQIVDRGPIDAMKYVNRQASQL